MRLILFALIVGLSCIASAADYDPLKLTADFANQPIDMTVNDANRSRDIPIRIYLPASEPKRDPPPVVVFSHGLGGTREGSQFLGKHWAARGFATVYVQHPGSDDSAWKNTPVAQRMSALQEAASLKNFMLRVQDVPAVLNQLEIWNNEASHKLHGRLNVSHVGMSGHSFGAQTTQALSGQSFDLGKQRLTDSRIEAAIIMSPGVPRMGSAERAFGDVKLPWLLMTGTHDSSPIGGQTPESRRGVFPALPSGDKYELVFDKAEHSVFTERALPGEKQARNPNHHRAILAFSTAFWDAYLKNDPSAKQWLNGDAARGLLESADLWQRK